MIGFWLLSYGAGLKPLGASPIPNFWGMVIATVALVQLGVGLWLDRHYNPRIARFYLWAAMYPLFSWLVMLVVTVTATPAALLGRRHATSQWRTQRVHVRTATVVLTPPHPFAPPARRVRASRAEHGSAGRQVGLPRR